MSDTNSPAVTVINVQNGIKRPEPGTLTGKLWDIADGISNALGRPAPRRQVVEEYLASVPDANEATANTQYARWVTYHGASDILRNLRFEETAIRRAQRAADLIAAKQAKVRERAERNAGRDAERAAKAEERMFKAAERAEAKRLRTEARAVEKAAKAEAKAAKAGEREARKAARAELNAIKEQARKDTAEAKARARAQGIEEAARIKAEAEAKAKARLEAEAAAHSAPAPAPEVETLAPIAPTPTFDQDASETVKQPTQEPQADAAPKARKGKAKAE